MAYTIVAVSPQFVLLALRYDRLLQPDTQMRWNKTETKLPDGRSCLTHVLCHDCSLCRDARDLAGTTCGAESDMIVRVQSGVHWLLRLLNTL